MQEYVYPDQTVFIKTHKGYVTSERKNRQIIQNIIRIIQECPYPDQNVLIETHKGYVTSNKNIARIAKRCPEKITSVVKCVELLFPKKLRE